MISFPDLIKKVFALYATHFRAFFAVVGLTMAWNIMLVLTPIDLAQIPKLIGPIIGISLLIALYTELLLVGTFSRLLEGRPLHASEIALSTLKRLPIYCIVVMLWALIVMLGTVLAIVPGIIFGSWFMFISSTFLIEHQGVVGTFKRSKALVAGYFFPLLLRVGGILLITFFIISTTSQGLFTVLKALVAETALGYVTIGSNVFGSILSALALPIVSGALVTLYYEMRRLKS